MTKEQLTQELLQEIKNVKDLAKEELPELAKEYILASKVQAAIGVGIGVLFLGLAVFFVIQGYKQPADDDHIGWYLAAVLPTIIGTVTSLINGSIFLDFWLQPKRMAIKAITSLM